MKYVIEINRVFGEMSNSVMQENYFDKGFVCSLEIMRHPTEFEDEDHFDFSKASTFYNCNGQRPVDDSFEHRELVRDPLNPPGLKESTHMLLRSYHDLNRMLDGKFENVDNVTVIVKVKENTPVGGGFLKDCLMQHPITVLQFK